MSIYYNNKDVETYHNSEIKMLQFNVKKRIWNCNI